ncbi:MAG: glycoside hydrolase family 97 protein [Bacteroidales bacterium]|nr:glycoside hydrolase family 97 protein [Bacteroidales bacterium]
MKTMKRWIMTAVLVVAAMTLQAKEYVVSSPDGAVVMTVTTGDRVTYSVSRRGTLLLAPSELAVTLSDGTVYGGKASFSKVVRRSVQNYSEAPFHKRRILKDMYNELTLKGKGYDIVFRVYDDGAAYRFVSAKPVKVAAETARFCLPEDWTLWVPYVRQHTETLESQFYNSFENTYEHHPVSAWRADRLAFLPVTVDAADGVKLCITESDLHGYPGMYLHDDDGSTTLRGVFAPYPDKVLQGGHNRLQGEVQTRMDYLADGVAELPWRCIVIATEDRRLADNDLVYRLARPAEGSDWSWVKPGKVAWDWWNAWNLYGVDFEAGINNETYQYYIDFAAQKGIEYVILDEGWAVNLQADLMQVVPEIDLPMLCRYAEERSVGLILWAGYWAFNRDMDAVCRHYADMGIKGWKIDFMDRDDAEMVSFYERAAATTAKHHQVVDFHGAYKPTGLQRTWPNVLNFEGVFGQEQMKWSKAEVDQVTYDVTIPFTRLVAGPADYTQGAMRNASKGNYRAVYTEPMSQGTRCRQLAGYIVFDAPLTMLCDSPSNYLREAECTGFIASVPTVWDETVALDGRIGEYIVMARRKGAVWYIGAMTDWTERDITIDFGDLGITGGEVEVFRDGPNAHHAARDYVRETVSADTPLSLHLAPGGGFALVVR